MKLNNNSLGATMGIVSGISYGFYGIFSSMLLAAGVSDMSIVALPALSLFLFFGIKTLFKLHVLKEIPRKIYLLLILQGGIVSTAMNFCYTQAYASGMPVGVVAIVAFCNVIVVMILSKFILSYNFSLPKIAAVAVAIFGVSLVIGLIGGGDQAGVYTTMGLMWTLLIPVFYGLNVVLNTYALVKGADSDAVLMIAQGASLIVVLVFMVNPVALFQDLAANLTSTNAWIGLLGFFFIPHVITYASMQESLKRIDPTIYQIMMSLDPVTALILGILIMGQAIAGLQILGIVIVLAAVTFITIMDGRDAKKEADAAETAE